jgi:hypothetical protein
MRHRFLLAAALLAVPAGPLAAFPEYPCFPHGLVVPLFRPTPVVVVPEVDWLTRVPDLVASGRSSEDLFWAGTHRLADGERRHALALFLAAIQLEPRDARFWYFRALAENSLGDSTAARLSARRGSALEQLNPEQEPAVLAALERVQGAPRIFLRRALPWPAEPALLADIVAGRDPLLPPTPK